jgi:hypothetical protein
MITAFMLLLYIVPVLIVFSVMVAIAEYLEGKE